MTREETIDILIREKDEDPFMRTEYRNKIHEALNMAIKVLKQEPCEDCISREAAIEAIYDNDYKKDMRRAIETLPSVNPQEKAGHWYIDERPESNRETICSNCEKPIFAYHKLDFDYRPKYCPNCGAKMSEI